VEEIIAEKLVIYHVKSVDDELIYKGRICCRECAGLVIMQIWRGSLHCHHIAVGKTMHSTSRLEAFWSRS